MFPLYPGRSGAPEGREVTAAEGRSRTPLLLRDLELLYKSVEESQTLIKSKQKKRTRRRQSPSGGSGESGTRRRGSLCPIRLEVALGYGSFPFAAHEGLQLFVFVHYVLRGANPEASPAVAYHEALVGAERLVDA